MKNRIPAFRLGDRMTDRQESPRQVLEYPGLVKGFAWVHLVFCCLLGVVFFYTIYAAIFLVKPEARVEVGMTNLMVGVLFAFNFLSFYRVLLPKARSRFYVFDDRLEVHEGSKITPAPFSEIVKIYGRVFPFVGGTFGLILSNGKIFNFSASLRGSEKLLDAISDFAPPRKAGLAELRANLVVFGHGFSRFTEFFKGTRAIVTFIHLALIPFGFSIYMVWRQSRIMTIENQERFFIQSAFGIYLAVFTLAAVFAITLNWIIDLPTLVRLMENPKDEARDLERENSIFQNALPFYLFALFSIMTAYNRFDLNTLSRTETPADVPHLGLHAGQRLWIDGRANCVGCPHSLREGDMVIFRRDGSAALGKLVSLPTTRAPASEQSKTPLGKLVIRSNANGDLEQVVDVKDVLGRAEEDLGKILRSRD